MHHYLIFHASKKGVISGIMRASGRQAVAALVNFVSYYVVGLPLGIILSLVVGLKAKGLWIGLSVGDFIQVGADCILVPNFSMWTHETNVLKD